jgi:transcription antitermination factor NusB
MDTKKSPEQAAPINLKQAREPAFFLLFEWAFQPEQSLDALIENMDEAFCPNQAAKALVGKALEQREAIDALIEQHSTAWKINRLTQVTLALLRMAICEILYFDDVPVGATINEVVELAKVYDSPDAAAYINGVLGALVRQQGAGE